MLYWLIKLGLGRPLVLLLLRPGVRGAQHLPRTGLEQVPGGDEVQRRVRRAEAADVDHPGQPAGPDQHVAGREVAVGHGVRAGTGQQAQLGPEPA